VVYSSGLSGGVGYLEVVWTLPDDFLEEDMLAALFVKWICGEFCGRYDDGIRVGNGNVWMGQGCAGMG
jgi:hypothetical protein